MDDYLGIAEIDLAYIAGCIDCDGSIQVTRRNRILACTGGFLKGYDEGTENPLGHPAAGYVEKAMLTPTALGGVMLFIRPRMRNGRVVVDVDISL
ncbi:hypothetical protein LCGC14_2560020 [marine sediment metagenome]|uniref:Uncharacterized protein n=1 Tax=marine sediment metagenome TaxID=412755 RepID=A0A0F9CWG8_9ZZZZ